MFSAPTKKPRYGSHFSQTPLSIARDTKMTPTPMNDDATSGLFVAVTASAAMARACWSATLPAAEAAENALLSVRRAGAVLERSVTVKPTTSVTAPRIA